MKTYRSALLLLVGTSIGCATTPPTTAFILPPKTVSSKHEQAYRAWHKLRLTGSIVRGEAGVYSLSGSTTIQRKLLSTHSARKHFHFVADPFHARVSNIRAWNGKHNIEKHDIVHFTPELPNVFLSDFKAYAIDYGAPRVGDTLGYSYQSRYHERAFSPIYHVPNIDYLEHFELVVEHPLDVTVEFRLFAPRDKITPKITRQTGKTTLRIGRLDHQQALRYFSHNGFHLAIRPIFSRAGKSLSTDNKKGFSKWFRRLLNTVPVDPRQEKLLAKKLTHDVNTTEEKLRRIYDFARKKVRYVADERGVNSWKPRPASKVAHWQYGDCKDKAFLIQRLALAVGIAVDLVLVSVNAKAKLGIRAGMFDHMVASYQRKIGKRIFLDATCRHCEYGNWPESDVDKAAMLFKEKAAEQLLIPAPNQQHALSMRLDVNDDHAGVGVANIVLRNGLNRWLRHARKRYFGRELQRRLSALIGRRLQSILLRKLVIIDSNETRTELRGEVDLSHMLVASGKRLYLSQTPFSIVPPRLLDRRQDHYPIHLPQRDSLSLSIRIHGKNLSSAALGKSTILGKKGSALLTSTLSRNAEGLIAKYVYRPPTKHLAKEQRQDFLSFCRRYRQSQRKMLVIERLSRQGSPSKPVGKTFEAIKGGK